MKINVYYWNNQVGVVNDAILIKSALPEHDVVIYDLSKNNDYRQSDLGIFTQNFYPHLLEKSKKNIFLVNEEWLGEIELKHFKDFDYIFTKSEYAKKLLSSYHNNVINTGFFSLDKYFFPNDDFGGILHFKGKAIQKNHELCFKYKEKYNIDILDSEVNYLSDEDLSYRLNNTSIHICCSLYEGWGHYVWEAMSCGKLVICSSIPVFMEYLDPTLVKFLPTQKIAKHDLDNRFLKETRFPFREGHFVKEDELINLLNKKEELFEFQKKHKDDIRYYFLEVNRNNKNKFNLLINYII